MRRPTRTTPTPTTIALPLFLLPALTSALSLSSFQTISTSNTNCLSAYSATIPSCQASDFTNGAACSAACVQSLESVQTKVAKACQDIAGPPDTLLGSLLAGNMVVALCPNVQTSFTVVHTPAPASGGSSPSSSSQTTQTTQAAAAAAAKSSATSTSSATTTTAAGSSSASGTTSKATSSTAKKSSSSAPLTSTASQMTSVFPSSFSTSVISAAQASPTAKLSPSASAQQGTGGGSPFQVATSSGASRGKAVVAGRGAALVGVLGLVVGLAAVWA